MPGRPAHSWEAADDYLNSVFDKCDANKDGKLQASELKVALKELSGESTSDEDVELLMARLDMDHDGAITKVSRGQMSFEFRLLTKSIIEDRIHLCHGQLERRWATLY